MTIVYSMKIGELARRAGVRASSIRYYESIHLLPEPERVSGQRRYGPEAVRLLAVIAAARRGGLSLDEIRELLVADRAGSPVGMELRRIAQDKLPEIDARIEEAHAKRRWLEAASECACTALDDCSLVLAGDRDGCA